MKSPSILLADDEKAITESKWNQSCESCQKVEQN